MTPRCGPVTLHPLPGLRAPLRLYTHDPAADLVSARLHAERAWEPFESRLLLACLAPEAVALDVGANLGYFALLFALATARPQRVVAVEPAADNFALLSANLSLNDCVERVTALPLALAQRDGNGRLHRSADNLGDHQLHGGDGERRAETVVLRAGAPLLREAGLERIDLLKVDTQGAESAVLRGLWPLLERSADGLRAVVELTPWSLRAAGSSGRELVSLLAALELPLAIVDHVAGRVVPHSAEALCRWSDNVDACPGDRGFMNLFAGTVPPRFR